MAKEISTYTHDGMELPFEDWSNTLHSFGDLTSIIQTTHDAALSSAVKAINRMQTMRNWLIGYYIVEYEQNGKDRAEYGAKLLKKLEERVNRKGMTTTLFKWARKFYRLYPQMSDNLPLNIFRTVSDDFGKQKSATVMHQFVTPGKTIISHLSFTHLREIMTLNDPLARYFYEQECIKCTWSVRELRRQISTNLYVRAGISANPDKLLSLPSVQGHDSAELQIRQPFTFEFLGLKAQDIVDEHDLEEALISHLQEFILELGKGFCFESRQKRIIIDDEYFYPDLVFYNRILHCGVIIELKNEEFSYENFGQLNAYVSHYRENEMQPGDNPPIGILLCTRKGKKMVEYALAGMDNQLFVSTYMLQLPDKKTLEEFLLKQLEKER
ncbi:MAG: PDDEXK nuclease domain-containing protein [Prevotella sp.]|uniref:PDDEXK nuclease domain-containing protein n=1 Tax=Prevotella sp. TaxID=59823 RepID=UPI0025E8A404|nr:PDDEXK nuclease domain-containing protein [Prevotella sp.]MCI7184112.1 PDDEXK nuclease domain-containing protein [Prevotella sp.]